MKKAMATFRTKFSMLFVLLLVFTLVPAFSAFGATVTQPSITWKEVSPFHEKTTDDGTVNGVYDITLTGGKFQPVITDAMIHTTSLPIGLSPKVTRTSGTSLHVTLTGAATAHDQDNSVTNVQFHVQKEAFVNSSVAVANTTLSNVKITFTGMTKFNVSGTVKDKASSKGLAATVQLKDSTGKAIGAAVKADANGAYSIPAVRIGKGYTLTATLDGYHTVTTLAFEVKHATTIPLVMEQIVYTVKGVVKSSDKPTGLAGAKVQLFDAAGKAVGAVVTTKANGSYEIASVKPAKYTVHATVKGYKAFISPVFEVKANFIKDCVLVKDVKVVYTISGKITGSNKPTGLAAKIQLKDTKGKKIGSVVTANAKGVFQIKSVATGEYVLSVSMTGYTPVNTAKFKVAKNTTVKTIVLKKTK